MNKQFAQETQLPGNEYVSIPEAIGYNADDIEKIAHIMYSRFYHYGSKPCLKHPIMKNTKEQFKKIITEVIDSIAIHNGNYLIKE